MKKFTKFVQSMLLAVIGVVAVLGLSVAGTGVASADDAPNYGISETQNVFRESAVQGEVREGSQGTTRDATQGTIRVSYKAEPSIKQGYATLCNTNAAGGYGHALDKACG